MKYATRTCYECGCKRPQPDMLRRCVQVDVGYSQRSLSASEIVMTAFSQNAQRSVARRFTSPNKRKHIRNKEVWMCYSCAGVETPEQKAERQAKEKAEKDAAEAKRISDAAAKKVFDDAARNKEYRALASNYNTVRFVYLLQILLYCFMLYIPLSFLIGGMRVGKCFRISLFYYVLSIPIYSFHQYEGIRWDMMQVGAAIAVIEFFYYRSVAAKGRKIPPTLQ